VNRQLVPDPDTLATLVSNVTHTMCGISFEADATYRPSADAYWRLATLAILGARPIVVALCSSHEGCTALGAALFSCSPETLDQSMLDDSLCELLNMAAGQIKGALGLDQPLGLPKIAVEPELTKKVARAVREGVMLRSRENHGLLIWVSEGAD
jgi:hypothetical protein